MSTSSSLHLSPDSSGVAEQRTLITTSLPAGSSTSAAETAKAYENICGICFTDVHPVDNPRGRLNSCSHLYCSYCIKEWAKNTNVCPSCKMRFTRIYTLHPQTGKEEETKVRKRNYVAWETTYDDDDDDGSNAINERVLLESVLCDVCQQSHNAARMIFCDRRQCVYAAHIDCLGLAERPVTFLCACCAKLREEESDLIPLKESFTATETAHASTKPVIKPMPVIIASPSVSAPTRSSAAVTSTLVPQSQVAVPPDVKPSNCGVAEMPTGLPARSALRSTAGEASVPCVPPTTSTSLMEHHTGSPTSSSPLPPSRAVPSRKPRSSTVPRAPIDFSKPHLSAITPTTALPRQGRMGCSASPHADCTSGAEDDYYFLKPTSHTVAASLELSRVRQERASEAQSRHQRDRAKAERLLAVYGVHHRDVVVGGARKRARSATSAEVSAELEMAEKEFDDPQQRRVIQERMVRRWAVDMLPELRRRRYIEGDTATTEADLWIQATTRARSMVREKLEARGEALRRRREQLVRVQAQREAAALAKLARIIAQHRERSRTQA